MNGQISRTAAADIQDIQKGKRDPAVDLARIAGCLIVVGIHCWDGTSDAYADDFSHNLISCLLSDGVAVFWMISGCFLFRNYSFRKTMQRTLKKIIVPAGIYSLFMFLIGGDLLYGTFTWEGILTADKLKNALLSLLVWENPVSSCSHLWYLYVYILVMVFSPALYGLVCWMEEDSRRETGFLLLSFGLFLLNDVTGNEYWAFSQVRLNGAFPAAVELMWGHILYRRFGQRTGQSGMKWLLFPAGFLCLDLLRARIQMARFQSGSGNTSILFWYSTFGLLCAACILLGCLFLLRERGTSRIARGICRAGSLTFTVYLIHTAVKRILYNLGLRTALEAMIGRVVPVNTAVYEILCLILTACTVALTAFAAAWLFHAAVRGAARSGQNKKIG